MKYKLIDSVSKIETLCEKVTIDDFDYYVSDEKYVEGELLYCMTNGWLQKARVEHLVEQRGNDNQWKKVIATNNPNIDVPKVVDEVEELSEKFIGCKYEDIEDSIDQIGYDSFKRGYNKSQETHPNSDDDMIEFGEWCKNLQKDNKEIRRSNPSITTKELLQLWKEQKPKIVYYE